MIDAYDDVKQNEVAVEMMRPNRELDTLEGAKEPSGT